MMTHMKTAPCGRFIFVHMGLCGLVVLSNCTSVFSPDYSETRPAALVYFGAAPQIDVPDSVQSHRGFTVTVTSYAGSSFRSIGETRIVPMAQYVDIYLYDIYGPPNPSDVEVTPQRIVAINPTSSGNLTLRFHGINVTSFRENRSEAITVLREVLVY